MFCFNLGETAVDEFSYSRFTFKISLGLQHGSGSSVKATMPLSAALPLATDLVFFGLL